jgi:hypothetical protein
MDNYPPLVGIQETSEYQTTKRVSTISSDSFPHSKKYTKSHVQSQTKTTTRNFTSKNPFSILQTEEDAQTPTVS